MPQNVNNLQKIWNIAIKDISLQRNLTEKVEYC